jgi:hypothetical protein
MKPSRESLEKRAEQLTLFELYRDHLDAIEKTFAIVYGKRDKRVCAVDLQRCGMEAHVDAAWFIAGLKRVGIIDSDCIVLMPEQRIEWLIREAKTPTIQYSNSPYLKII